jgi:hypothetical protein
MGEHGDAAEELVKELGVGIEVPLVCFAIGVYLVSGMFGRDLWVMMMMMPCV